MARRVVPSQTARVDKTPGALAAISAGLSIFPGLNNSKGEHTGDPAKKYTAHGAISYVYWPDAVREFATRSEGRAVQWWTIRPECNIKALIQRGQCCAEIDRRNGGEATAAGREWTPTYHDNSPNGWHKVYALPPDITLRGTYQMGPGLEVHLEGAAVLCAGSRTPKGEYTPGNGPRCIMPAPDWLIESLRAIQAAHESKRAAAELASYPEMKADGAGCTAYGTAALLSEAGRVKAAAKGVRHDTLGMAAYYMGQLVAAGYLPASLVESTLVDAATSAGWTNTRKITRCVQRGLKSGLARPRYAKAKEFVATAKQTARDFLNQLFTMEVAGRWAAGNVKGKAVSVAAESVRDTLIVYLRTCESAGRMVANLSQLQAGECAHMSSATAWRALMAAQVAGLLSAVRDGATVERTHTTGWDKRRRARVYMLSPLGWQAWAQTNKRTDTPQDNQHGQPFTDKENDLLNFWKKSAGRLFDSGLFQFGALGRKAFAVVRWLATYGPSTAAQIAAGCRMSASTVYMIIGKLASAGMMTETTQATSGRPRKLAALAPDALNARAEAARANTYYKGANVVEREAARATYTQRRRNAYSKVLAAMDAARMED